MEPGPTMAGHVLTFFGSVPEKSFLLGLLLMLPPRPKH
jgi:hypothetical protein